MTHHHNGKTLNLNQQFCSVRNSLHSVLRFSILLLHLYRLWCEHLEIWRGISKTMDCLQSRTILQQRQRKKSSVVGVLSDVSKCPTLLINKWSVCTCIYKVSRFKCWWRSEPREEQCFSVSINLGNDNHFDNQNVSMQLERLFQLIPFKKDYKRTMILLALSTMLELIRHHTLVSMTLWWNQVQGVLLIR